jgi:hypothetical protein
MFGTLLIYANHYGNASSMLCNMINRSVVAWMRWIILIRTRCWWGLLHGAYWELWQTSLSACLRSSIFVSLMRRGGRRSEARRVRVDRVHYLIHCCTKLCTTRKFLAVVCRVKFNCPLQWSHLNDKSGLCGPWRFPTNAGDTRGRTHLKHHGDGFLLETSTSYGACNSSPGSLPMMDIGHPPQSGIRLMFLNIERHLGLLGANEFPFGFLNAVRNTWPV